MSSEPKNYEKGNPWEKKVYRHMSNYIEGKGVKKFGSVNRQHKVD